MKIEINNKTVTFNHNKHKIEIHPIWLRERVNDKEFLDKKTEQNFFDPSLLKNIEIENAIIDADKRFLQRVFIDCDCSEGKMRHLIRKFNSQSESNR